MKSLEFKLSIEKSKANRIMHEAPEDLLDIYQTFITNEADFYKDKKMNDNERHYKILKKANDEYDIIKKYYYI